MQKIIPQYNNQQNTEGRNFKRNLIELQNESNNLYNIHELNHADKLFSSNEKFYLQINQNCQLEVYQVNLKQEDQLIQKIKLYNIDYSQLKDNFTAPFVLKYGTQLKSKKIEDYSHFYEELFIWDSKYYKVWQSGQKINHLYTDILNDYGILQINRVQCYYQSKLYYNNNFGFQKSLNVFFTEEFEQLSQNGQVKFRINDDKGCFEIHKQNNQGNWDKIWESKQFNINIQKYKEEMRDLDEKLKEAQKQYEIMQKELGMEFNENLEYLDEMNKEDYDQQIINLKLKVEQQGISNQQANQLVKVQHYKDEYELQNQLNRKNKFALKMYNFRLLTENDKIFVEDRYGNHIWEHKLRKQSKEDLIQIQNSGNLVIKNKDFEVRWQTFTGGLKQRFLYYLELFIDQVLDPMLFLGDTYSDIFLLIEFYNQRNYTYFSVLLTCMGIDRLVQFIFLFSHILDRYDQVNVVKIRCFQCIHQKFDKLIYAFLSFLYLDPILDQNFVKFSDRKEKKMYRKIFECFFEALPSMFLNIHSIFNLMHQGDIVDMTQFIALVFSIVSASKSLFEIKVFLIHDNSWQKMLGPKLYEQGYGSYRASVQGIMMIFIFLISYCYSFGVYTDITRPYGIIVFLLIIFGILFLVCFVFISRIYYKDVIEKRNEKQWWEIFLFFILYYFFSIPISAIFLTVIISLGAYVDWILDFKNDPLKQIAALGLYWFLSYLRIGISALFFVTYVNEDNYAYTTFGFLIYIHFIYNVIYHVIFMIQVKKTIGFGQVCQELCSELRKFPY